MDNRPVPASEPLAYGASADRLHGPAGRPFGAAPAETAPQEDPLVGRAAELAVLEESLVAATAGRGGMLLIAGEAGVGKTRLARAAFAQSDLAVLAAAASPDSATPFAPIVAGLRSYLHRAPDGLRDVGPLAAHLALLMPELGPVPAASDRPTLFEAVRCAFAAAARRRPVAVFLDDLHWADAATLELLPTLVSWLEGERILIVGAYRNDELPRGHAVRRLRTELRRAGRLRELAIGPLDAAETAVVAARFLGGRPSPRLASVLHDRSQGIPFVIEELAIGLAEAGRLQVDSAGVELAGGEAVPIPDTVRDAVLIRLGVLPAGARQVLDAMAVVGVSFDLELIVALVGEEDGLTEVIERGFVVEGASGQGAFRHALTREVLYAEVPWPRRRALHRRVATALEAAGAPPGRVAEHWLAGREPERARHALLAAAERSWAVHAYRDAAEAARRALELWPDDGDEPTRLAVLDRLGRCAQLAGDLASAVGAWEEAAAGHRHAGNALALAGAERHLAGVLELQGAWERALVARQAAAEDFGAAGLPAEAAAERLAAAAHLHGAGRFGAALPLAAAAQRDAERAGRADLLARAIALDGSLRAKLGEVEAGIARARAGLALALAHGQPAAAAEAYQRLATALEHAEDYAAARETYRRAHAVCEEQGIAGVGQVCLACLGNLLWQAGDWEEAFARCEEVRGSGDATPLIRAVATWIAGCIVAAKGEAKRARPLLHSALAAAQHHEYTNMEIGTTWWLARADELDGDPEAALARARTAFARWARTEERHYVVPDLRWGATFFAGRGAAGDLAACANGLAEIAAATGRAEALSALAHALGETALLDGDAAQAALHFGRALELLRGLELPYDRAQVLLRSGTALAAAGQQELGIEHLTDAYRSARKLGARPLAERAARALAALGEPVERRLGRRAAGRLERGGLSRRELEIIRRLALGRTNKEIARELFLSERTVEMHVGNALAKLDCRSRAEAARKAEGLGLLA